MVKNHILPRLFLITKRSIIAAQIDYFELRLNKSMSKISIIDDDAALELLVENLYFRGHDANRFSSISSALGSLDDILSSEFIVLDIIMDLPTSHTERIVSGVRTSGMAIFKSVREKNTEIPILAYSACQDKDIIELINRDPNSRFIGKWTTPSIKDIVGMECTPMIGQVGLGESGGVSH